MQNPSRTVDFVIAGVQKAGTTTLYHLCDKSPAISMSPKKEISFFDLNYSKGIDWYHRHFEAFLDSSVLLGEASPHYLYCEDAPNRIFSYNPRMKLIFIFRNPIDRAYSNYRFNILRGVQNPKISFSQAIATDDGYKRYISKGFYANYLKKYLDTFPRQSIFTVLFDDLRHDQEKVLENVESFLGVPHSVSNGIRPILSNKTQNSPKSLSILRYKLIQIYSIPFVKRSLAPFKISSLYWIGDRLISSFLDNASENKSNQDISLDLRIQLEQLFHKPNEDFFGLIGKPNIWSNLTP